MATNGSRVWVTGPDGLVLAHDADGGGGAWATEDSQLDGDLYAVTTRGAGAAVGGYAGQVSTSTGAGTWVPRSRGIDGELMGVSATDAQHAWIAGSKGGGESVALIYATSDGGLTWVKQLEDDAMNWLGDVAMVDAQHGWAVGWGGGIVTTTDGSTWTTQVAPAWPMTSYDGVACGDDQHAVAVGYPGNGKNLSATVDGGTTWISPASGVTGELMDVSFGDATHAWAVGGGGGITSSADGGATWTPQTSGVTDDLRAVDFVDALNGWATGNEGVILHTTDGGANWSPQSSGTDSPIQAVRFLTPQKGWAVTVDGSILQTADGGASWADAGPRCSAVLHDLTVVDATHALTVGSWGAVLAMDVVRPTVKGRAPSRVQHKAVRVRFRAADAQSGVALVEYRVGRGPWRAGTSVKVTRNGKTTIRCRATDGAGNRSAVKRVTLRISR